MHQKHPLPKVAVSVFIDKEVYMGSKLPPVLGACRCVQERRNIPVKENSVKNIFIRVIGVHKFLVIPFLNKHLVVNGIWRMPI